MFIQSAFIAEKQKKNDVQLEIFLNMFDKAEWNFVKKKTSLIWGYVEFCSTTANSI